LQRQILKLGARLGGQLQHGLSAGLADAIAGNLAVGRADDQRVLIDCFGRTMWTVALRVRAANRGESDAVEEKQSAIPAG